MNTLQVQVEIPFRYHWIEPQDAKPDELIILLHGYAERADRIVRLLQPALPATSAVLAPNGTFPVPYKTDDGYKDGFSWYFFDSKTETMKVPPDASISAIKQTIEHLNVKNLPIRIVGFSQGAYFAPILGRHLSQTRHVIGIAGGFPARYFGFAPSFRLDAVHGALDKICDYATARADHQKLIQNGWEGEFVTLPETAHRIDEAAQKEVARLLRQGTTT